MVTIYRLDELLYQFGTSLLFHVQFCCFLTCIQISQEAGKVVWYSPLCCGHLKTHPQKLSPCPVPLSIPISAFESSSPPRCLVPQSCPTLYTYVACSLPGSSVHGNFQARILEWDALFQGIFPTQESNPGLPHCRRILYCLSHQGSPRTLR